MIAPQVKAIGPAWLVPPAGPRNRGKATVKIRQNAPLEALPRKGFGYVLTTLIYLCPTKIPKNIWDFHTKVVQLNGLFIYNVIQCKTLFLNFLFFNL